MKTLTTAHLRAGATLGLAGLLVLAAGGCKVGADGSPASSGGSSASPKAKMLTGKKMNTLLLPASAMPKGFRLESDGARNTGDGVAPRSAESLKPGEFCGALLKTSWIRVSEIGSATFAQNDYVDAGKVNQFAQEIDGYHSGDAEKVMTKLRSAFKRCASFVDRSNGMTAKVKLVASELPGTGDDAVRVRVTSPAWQGGTTMVAIRVGDNVVTTLYSSSHKDRGSAAVPMAKRIADNVRSAG